MKNNHIELLQIFIGEWGVAFFANDERIKASDLTGKSVEKCDVITEEEINKMRIKCK